ncbi:hypothetical protein HK100_000271 [Physocladia obscura]|uniref:N-acetyltransferase domain-containing protein n=1 Tax=Physocladia obscura TaxID=109957 RepID=A0AAD5SZK1_9FUNG|nr:hypothetical protein HK100_000271 [Physocladia obscura]
MIHKSSSMFGTDARFFTHDWCIALTESIAELPLIIVPVTMDNMDKYISSTYNPQTTEGWTRRRNKFSAELTTAQTQHEILRVLLYDANDINRTKILGFGAMARVPEWTTEQGGSCANLGIQLEPEMRGRGVGLAFLRMLLRLSCELAVDRVEIVTMEDNLAMRALARKAGLAETLETRISAKGDLDGNVLFLDIDRAAFSRDVEMNYEKTVDVSPMSSNHSRAPHLPHLQTQLLPSVIRQHHPFSAAPDQETAQDSNADIELLSYRESVTEDNKDKVKDCDNQNCVQQMTDLEIENESLIAMNVSLQNTVRNQARNVVQMRREINSLKRKSCDSEMLDNSESPNTEEPDLDIISPQLHNSYRLSVLSANSINVSVDETFVESVEAHHKSEQQYNVLCSTISQLIEEGQRALNETPIAETDSNSTTPQVSHNSMQFARTVSSIFEPHKNLPDSGRNSERKEQHVEHEPRNHNASSAYFIPHKSDQEHRQLLLTRAHSYSTKPTANNFSIFP